MGVFEHFRSRYDASQQEQYSLKEFLEICRDDATSYATAAERLLLAVGKPEFVDTSKDARLSRIFSNKVIKRYPAFDEFYGMEEAIEQIVSFFRHAAQGLEERKQILYLLGPVGGGKSSLAERLEVVDAADAVLRDRRLAGERVAARLVRRSRRCGHPRR